MEEHFEQETARLTKSWMQYDADTLRDYLVQDVEDPRINVQSILTRHFLIERLFGGRFRGLMDQELRFGCAHAHNKDAHTLIISVWLLLLPLLSALSQFCG